MYERNICMCAGVCMCIFAFELLSGRRQLMTAAYISLCCMLKSVDVTECVNERRKE